MAGRGRGRGIGRTVPAWMLATNNHPPPSLSKSDSKPTSSEWRTATAKNGHTYWYNPETGATSWTDPNSSQASSTDEWRESRTPEGRVYYYNSKTRETRWTKPDAAMPAVQAPLPPGWVQNKAPDGRVYYYHSTTRETRWTRPAVDAPAVKENKPPTPLLLPPGWAEYKANDGRPYYYHAATRQTSWSHPGSEPSSVNALNRPGKHVRDAQPQAHSQGPPKRPRIADVQGANRTQGFHRPRDEDGEPMSNRQAEKWLLARARKRKAGKVALNNEGVAKTDENGATDVQKEDSKRENERTTTKSEVKEEASNPIDEPFNEHLKDNESKNESNDKLYTFEKKRLFMNMLDERGVKITSSWFLAMCLCVEDERYLLVPTYGDRKTAFHSWVQKKKSSKHGDEIKASLKASDDYLEMLKRELDKEPMYRRAIEDCRADVVKRIRECREYRAIKSDAKRQSLTRAFFDLRKREQEQRKEQERWRMLRTARATLDAMTNPEIRPQPRRGRPDDPPAVQKEYGPPWLDDRTKFREVDRRLHSALSFYRELDSRDIRDIFENWLRDVDLVVDERLEREKEARKNAQRDRRAKFRESVLAMLLDGRVDFRAAWRDVATEIGREEFACSESELGERPANLFKDSLKMFDDRVLEHKDEFKEAIRAGEVIISDRTSVEELMKVEGVAKFFEPLEQPIREALLLDRQKKEHRRRKHAVEDFEGLMRNMVKREEMKLEATYDESKEVLADKKETLALRAVMDEEGVRKAFDEFVERRRRHLKRRSDEPLATSVKRPRFKAEEETGWAAAVSATPLTAAEKAAALNKRKRDLLALKAAAKKSVASSPPTAQPKTPRPPKKEENIVAESIGNGSAKDDAKK